MRIKQIEIQNYKAFKDRERLDIEGKNVLIYGDNGSGKSSLYYALSALFRSSAQTQEQIQRHFDPQNDERILNIFAPEGTESFVRVVTDDDSTFEFSLTGNTDDETIRLANQASDFMNYRLLFRFYNFRNAEDANIFPIFLLEFFPYWTDPERNISYEDWYRNLESELQTLQRDSVRKDSRRYNGFLQRLHTFNEAFESRLLALPQGTNGYLQERFLPGEPIQVSFRYRSGLTTRQKWVLEPPVLQLVLEYDGKPIPRPHTFLNEARLTALALSIRLAAFDQRLKSSDFKILVLDDLLISLDMSIRMKLIDIVLTKYAAEYQLLVMTHNRGFFDILRQNLALKQDEWKFYEFYEKVVDGEYANPVICPNRDALEKAHEFLENHDYESCALYLRKKVEEIVRIYFDPSLEEIARFHVLETLANALGNLERESRTRVFNRFSKLLDSQSFTLEQVQKLKAERFQGDGTLSPQEKGVINHLRVTVMSFLEEYYQERDAQKQELAGLVSAASKVSEVRARMLNVGAHCTDEPLYKSELEEALKTIKEFEEKVKSAKRNDHC